MDRSRSLRRLLPVVFALGVVSWRSEAGTITLDVDAREAPRRLFHAKLQMPVAPGKLDLVYPKWIPGEHAPTGPIADLAGLKVVAAGKPLAWRRDSEDMYRFHLIVPAGVDSIEVSLDYLSPSEGGRFSSGATAAESLAVVSWNEILLYPAGARSDSVQVAASILLPAGWKYGTALETASDRDGRIQFKPVSLTTLVDSPILTGLHFRTVPLTESPRIHRIYIAADSDAALEMSPELTEHYRHLVAETGELFGARHYGAYSFLLTLSDHTAHFGLEHHESSDDRTSERALLEEDRRLMMSGLLSHEMVHSWNGKYRRPADLTTPDFQQPMHDDLLWVYEGLTTYLGDILAARCGLQTPEQFREMLAMSAAELDHRRGREWRSLADTAVSAQLLYGSRADWPSWRRRTDFYPESALIWLEVDMIIRDRTQGKRSLDDFCRLFFGGKDGPPELVTYTFDSVVAALNQVLAFDWSAFLNERLNSTAPGAPLKGLEASGWKLGYTDMICEWQKAEESTRKSVDVRYSLGFRVDREDSSIFDVIPGSPADLAGISPSMQLVAVNGRKWSPEVLRDAILDAKIHPRPIEVLIENSEIYRTVRIEYSGGARYPCLQANGSVPDTLSKIIAAKAPEK